MKILSASKTLWGDVSPREIIEAGLIACFALLAVTPGAVWVMDGDLPHWLLHEGGLYEHGSAFVSGLAAVFFLLAYRRVTDRWAKFWVMMLALGTFLLAGEEVSWGQHIFGFETPAVVRDNNFQGEMNLHNLSLIQDSNNALTAWLFRALMAYLILLPLLVRVFPTLAKLCASLDFPVPTLAIAVAALFAKAGTTFSYQLVYGHSYVADVHRVGETVESLFQLCLLWFSIELWRRYRALSGTEN